MRARKIKNSDARRAACKDMILDIDKDSPQMTDLRALFPGFSRFRLEVGCGKGGFIRGESRAHPDIAYIAVELISDICIQAAEKTIAEGCENVRFINTNAKLLPLIFPAESFERIHLNFSDPWPKARHEKRRLTSCGFLALFRPLLTRGGCIAFKTDNAPLFEYSLPEFEASGFRTEKITRDLHNSEYYGCDTETEYEKAFAEKGTPICRCEAFLTD